MDAGFKVFVGLAAAFMAAILLLDSNGLLHQFLLGIATAAFVAVFCWRSDIAPAQVLCCIVVATIGEIVLSIGWGLYSYQHALIPLYVPPGHGLFYALALASSRQPIFRKHERTINRSVLIAGTLLAFVSLALYGDTWGFLWWVGAAALLVTSKNQLMLSACFSYTILLEWAGTANGNWHWAADVPFLGLRSANPPAGVGILYILLDLIVVAITARLFRAGEAVATEPDSSELAVPDAAFSSVSGA
jgi:hypothetical protein